MGKQKSILDGMKIKETGATLGGWKGEESGVLTIVGHCGCGAPVYGHKTITVGQEPVVKRTCNCWRRPGLIEQTMETK